MNGWVGKILRVDLSEQDYVIEDLDPDFARDWIGGQGTASKILFDEIDPAEDSLRFYFLGANWRKRVEHIGEKKTDDPDGPLIV